MDFQALKQGFAALAKLIGECPMLVVSGRTACSRSCRTCVRARSSTPRLGCESTAPLECRAARRRRPQKNSRFVFVPGPGDPCASDALPQPPLPRYFTEDVLAVCPNAIFASNPCR